MNLNEQNFVCLASIGPKDSKQTCIHMYIMVQHVLEMTVIHGWEDMRGVEAPGGGGGQGATLKAFLGSWRMDV